MKHAIISIHNLYCKNCADGIKRELSVINNISNIYLCLKDSSISFNFVAANDISTVENHLNFLGFKIIGEEFVANQVLCYCMSKISA